MEKTKNNIYFQYTLVFLLFILIGLLPLELKSKTILGTGLYTDGLKQHLLFMKDYVSSILSFIKGDGLQLYRYNLGLGSDFILSYTYYSLFDPLTIIAYIIPIKYIEFSYYLIAIIRLYLSGIFFIILAKKFNILSTNILLVTSIFYVFNITVLYSAFRHPMFINGPMLLPLLILGAEKVLRHESPFLLIIVAFYALISQFYFYIYATFGFELYVIIRLWPQIKAKTYKQLIKSYFYVNFMFLVGALLGGFVLVPQFLATINSGRISSKGFILYKVLDYLGMISSYLIPMVSSHYSSSFGNIIIYFIVLIYLFAKKSSWIKPYFIILSLLMFISLFGYAINAFSYVNNRWSYLLNLPAALMLGEVMQGQVEDNALHKATKGFIITMIILVGLALIYVIQLINLILITIILSLMVAILIIYLINNIIKSKHLFGSSLKQYLNPKVLTRLSLISCFIVLLTTSLMYALTMSSSEGLSAYNGPQTYQIINDDPDFFRVDQEVYVLNTDYLGNDNINNGYNAPYFYNTMASGYIGQVIDYFNVVNMNNSVGYNGFNNRTSLNALNQVKYIIIRESEKTIPPYAFSPYATIQVEKYIPNKYNNADVGYIEYLNGQKQYETATIYRNNNFLHFGYMYHQYVTTNDLENYSFIDRENVLLDAVILNNDYNQLSKFNLTPISLKQNISDYELNNMEIHDNTILVKDLGGSLTFTIPDITNSEVLVEIKGISNTNKYQDFTVYYETNGSKQKEVNYGYGTNFHIENTNHLVNMGYFDNQSITVTITFEKGIYQFNSMAYYLNPMDDIARKVNSLNEETLTNLHFGNRGFSGQIDAKTAGLLFISLPYDKGFTAYVDNQEVKIEQANIGYMGIMVSQGQHEIRFVYETPGLKYGVYISLMAFIIIILIAIYHLIIRKREYHD